jgi:hypothetical protein
MHFKLIKSCLFGILEASSVEPIDCSVNSEAVLWLKNLQIY